jgi:regulator of ribonuclease activity A
VSVTADLFDRYSDRVAVCDLQWRSFGALPVFAGPCVPLWSARDHRPVLHMLEQPGEGRVLVVDVDGCLTVGVMGDRLGGLALRNGWAGVVINGVIRDSAAINAMVIGVKALGTTARRAQTPTNGSTSRAVEFGGVRFEPGHWVYADEDAVLVSAVALDHVEPASE